MFLFYIPCVVCLFVVGMEYIYNYIYNRSIYLKERTPKNIICTFVLSLSFLLLFCSCCRFFFGSRRRDISTTTTNTHTLLLSLSLYVYVGWCLWFYTYINICMNICCLLFLVTYLYVHVLLTWAMFCIIIIICIQSLSFKLL